MRHTREPRIVEIYSRGPDSYGTGYLLGGGIILTARHVLVPNEGGSVPEKLDIEVRTVDMTRGGKPPLPATLVWPRNKAELAVHESDIALLQMPIGPNVLQKPPALRLVGNVDGADIPFSPVIQVYAIGFPLFAEIPAGGRDTAQISGTVQPGAGMVTNTLQISQLQFNSRMQNNQPLDASANWKGFSGAALFASGQLPNAEDALPQLIGVVVTYNSTAPYDFGAVRIDALLDDAEAASVLNTALGRCYDTEPVEVLPVHNLVCLIDRTDQEQEFVATYRQGSPMHLESSNVDEHNQQSPAHPVISLLPGAGDARHAAPEMIERLKVKTLREELKWSVSCLGAVPLYWPISTLPPDVSMARLREDLWNRLAGNGPAPTDPAPYIKLWNDGSRPRLFVSDLLKRVLDKKTAAVLTNWSRFWAEMTPEDGCVPVHLLLLNASQEQTHDWLAQASHAPGVLISELPELDLCTNYDLDTWLRDELTERVHSGHHNFLARLDTQLRKDYPDQFYLRDVKVRVQELVNGEFV